jgi:uncharacterized membrane protein YsdA (DUF1294 family)/cold shock CspA family protein
VKKQGVVVRWQDDRGFGFIRSPGSADVFFHVRDYRGGDIAPREGLAVTFEEIHVGGKGPRAMAVQVAGAAAATRPPRAGPTQRTGATRRRAPARQDAPWSGTVVALHLMLAYGAALAWAVLARDLPWWVVPASVVLNIATFWLYWGDKHSATTGQWRTAEKTLHLWSLAGGWGGAWFAQQVHRHKTRKGAFQEAYWGTVVLHCGALAGWLWWMHR